MNFVSVVNHTISSHLRTMLYKNWMSDFRTKVLIKVSKFDSILKNLLYIYIYANRIRKQCKFNTMFYVKYFLEAAYCIYLRQK
jgi:hypothetical protein